MKNRDMYFYLYMATPILLTGVYYCTLNEIVSGAVFFIAVFTCIFLDRKALQKRVGDLDDDGFIGNALGVVLFPALYVYWRCSVVGLKKWRWFIAYIAIALGGFLLNMQTDGDESLKRTACEVTTSIFKDKNSDVKCLVVQDVKKVSDRHYRAKAMLSNGIDMPITIRSAIIITST